MPVADRAEAVARALAGWSDSRAPMYTALADALALAIFAARIAGHLPSERALARALHVSRGTVVNAYEILRERGLIERHRGSGSVAVAPRGHEICADPLACVRAFFEAGGPR